MSWTIPFEMADERPASPAECQMREKKDIGLVSPQKKPPHKGAGHRKRLREKFLKSGLSGFHDYEVIELLLTLATPLKDCKEMAKAAVKRFKTFRGVIDASPDELCKIKGIGPVNLFGIRLIKAASDRYLQERLVNKELLNNSKKLFEFLYHNKQDLKREAFTAIFLTAKNRVIAVETLFTGTLTSTSVYPREVVSAAIKHGAAALILAHNHPSGDPAPSRDDVILTERLLFACRIMGIAVQEHIIIGGNRYFSFADEGFISRINADYEKTERFD